ncbi:M48 family metallopeptidase [Candidatus Kaiserbacteria bacterium]|nr:M48 family metallopeptidase [Candidatus Kaiserbacteria bacterium]
MTISYALKHSRRARYMWLRVLPGGSVVVTAPVGSATGVIQQFVTGHARWIERAVARMSHFKSLPVSGRRAYTMHREEARAFVTERLAHWNRVYGFTYGRVAIKNTKRTWGSCSRKGNLNFAYTLLFLPRELADYVIVHELCHLGEHNHSKSFWALVGRALPDYRERRRELKRYLPRG